MRPKRRQVASGYCNCDLPNDRASAADPCQDAADQMSYRLDFTNALYPDHLWAHENKDYTTRDEADLICPDITVDIRDSWPIHNWIAANATIRMAPENSAKSFRQ